MGIVGGPTAGGRSERTNQGVIAGGGVESVKIDE
jgi:hypothetical protein